MYCDWEIERERSDDLGKSYEQHQQPSRENYPPWTDVSGGCGMRLFEELWYGNIEPRDYDVSLCK